MNSEARPRGFLVRLRDDQRGATLAMMAAVVIPMIGMVGGAVDISRAYLVKVRLQQACDAGVLAARRTMTGSSVANDTNAKSQADNFFKINLKDGAYGAAVTPLVVTDVKDAANNATGTVHGAASATVPTTLMRVFGKPSIAMTASCEATLQVANNDVMFVLDVTGSMNCAAADTESTCSNNGGVEKSNARIKALRGAVVDFYKTLAAATQSTAQLRVGIMPYSANVNVGKLLPSAYIASSAPYQSRIANMYRSTGSSSAVETYGSSISSGDCDDYGTNNSFSGFSPNPSGTYDQSVDSSNFKRISFAKKDWGATGDTSGTTRTCRRTKTTTTYTKDNSAGTVFRNYDYLQMTYDTSQFKLGNSVSTRTGNGGAMVSSTWNGCIEERQTVAQSTFSSIPTGAYDLDIDMLPSGSDLATQWKPAWPQVVFDRNSPASELGTTTDHFQPIDGGADFAPCPKQAMKLAVTNETAVSGYVNASDFKAVGGTYHDVGMLWGARFLSPTGIFSSENSSAPNGLPINRSIVFMTDGAMKPAQYYYGLYGYEKIDRRISGSATTPDDNDLKDRHNSRFNAICEAIKSKNITIYVVAYAQTMTTELQDCATPGKAFYAADDDDLTAAFQQIARQIAQLRLSK